MTNYSPEDDELLFDPEDGEEALPSPYEGDVVQDPEAV